MKNLIPSQSTQSRVAVASLPLFPRLLLPFVSICGYPFSLSAFQLFRLCSRDIPAAFVPSPFPSPCSRAWKSVGSPERLAGNDGALPSSERSCRGGKRSVVSTAPSRRGIPARLAEEPSTTEIPKHTKQRSRDLFATAPRLLLPFVVTISAFQNLSISAFLFSLLHSCSFVSIGLLWSCRFAR
jgi:hypothetical protein